jgi:hypothetical protein
MRFWRATLTLPPDANPARSAALTPHLTPPDFSPRFDRHPVEFGSDERSADHPRQNSGGLNYKPSVRRSAASTRAMSGKWPSLLAIALSKIVARLSVITTESVRSPAAVASEEWRGIKTRLAWPRRARLLVIIETKTCGSPVRRSSASTTSAGRCLHVTRSLFGNTTSTTSPRSRPVIRCHSRCVPVFLPGGQFAAHLGGLVERQWRGWFRRASGELFDKCQHCHLLGFRQRLRLVEYFFSRAHGTNLSPTPLPRKNCLPCVRASLR